ncbi:MAG: hypothetical protein KKB50_04460 [Planctomycetes bacterium]|nr:hypothetical protein [Planctomycetota bacterium]
MATVAAEPTAALAGAPAAVRKQPVQITSRLGLGPMSREVVDSICAYARETRIQLMLIASRNQVECAELGGGYVGSLSSEALVERVRRYSGGYVVVCRDHCGPYMAAGDAGHDPEAALARAVVSLKRDIEAGFDLIHVDCCHHRGDVREATAALLEEAQAHAERCGRALLFEVGTEENVGQGTDVRTFESDLAFILDLVRPEFVVGQTGSLVKETFQVGFFDYARTRRLVEVAHSYDVKFKEHNSDYLEPADLRLRSRAGVDAINVAPELGVAQTRAVVRLAQQQGLFGELDAFLRRAAATGKWRKWQYGSPDVRRQGLIAGHYAFGTDEYRALTARLGRVADVQAAIAAEIAAIIERYVGGML